VLWVAGGFVAWTVVAGLLAVLVGKMIRLADVRDHRTDEDPAPTLAAILSARDAPADAALRARSPARTPMGHWSERGRSCGDVPRPHASPLFSTLLDRRRPVPHLHSLPDDAVLSDVFRRFPDHAAPLAEYAERLMRGPSPLSVAQRELIGAYVSGLNASGYCQGVHTAIAVSQGIEEQLVAALVDDLATAPVEERMRPVLALARTVTLIPAKVGDAEVAAVYADGWDERALHDAVSVCGLFNMMNRLVEGLGITATPEQHRAAAERLAGSAGYVLA